MDEKKRQFDAAREREKAELQQRSQAKQQEIQKVIEQNAALEEQRKEQIR